MSLQTWMDEFYPTPAQKFPTELEAVEHSLRKWKGLTKESLEKHGVVHRRRFSIRDDAHVQLAIDSTTCALCVQHYQESAGTSNCDNCILKKVNVSEVDGQHYGCDETLPGEERSTFYKFIDQSNPQPMIELLEKAKAYLCQQNSAQNKA